MLFASVPICYTVDMVTRPAMIKIEVACATEEKQEVISLHLPTGTRLIDAVKQSAIESHFPQLDIYACKMGIYGQVESPDKVLVEGDRVEIYRPLLVNPRQARQNRAKAAKRK